MRTFHETQKFNHWWLWAILIPLCCLPLYGIFQQIILGKPWGSNPMSDNLLIVLAIIVIGFVVLLYLLTLKTDIDSDKIAIKFGPFVNKSWQWSDIDSAEVITYKFVGGWGIRLWTSYGTVYNVKGYKGLALQLKNGKKLLIGTQKEEELKNFVHSINQ